MDPFRIERTAAASRVTLAGDFTAALADSLRLALQKELDAGVTRVVFDLTQTVMLDSMGIGLLIATYNSLSGRQGRVVVENVSEGVLKLLQCMRLVQRLNVSELEKKEINHER